MDEGSHVVDEGLNLPTPPENDVDDSQGQVENNEETGEGEGQSGDGDEGDVKYTDKGTKLDPNPRSAVHQELANAKRTIQQMEQVLGNPETLKRYAAQQGLTLAEAKKEIKEEKESQEDVVEEISPDSLKTAGDVAKAMNQIRKESGSQIKALKEENERLRQGMDGFSSSQKDRDTLSTLEKDVVTVQSTYPELNPKSSDFDPDLEKEIGSLYEELDYDPATRKFRGNVSLRQVADRVMRAAGKFKKQGSKQAQTDVKVKQAGKVTSGKGTTKEAPKSDDPGTAIAQKIANAVRK